ncbi:tetratricopeptide (TPR) repeat protein [Rhabdobacter roseus]|uniref:Tetratricopeptide (TPR) repeat protein n=1 Tax=Rhabdobacter roseus TaxID=1655419 RepID=A0A840TN15_9BACT|nr:hypothetical protein [Rhabdobacter roseus]MBB5282613.1 tetratricopeptide (TPR) repeat protein [Rhabdobacter roseus]
MHWKLADDEYDRYKKRADAFFDRGDYLNALRQYRNCLEVPTYENDPYAKGRIALVEKLVKLREEAHKALNAGKGEEAAGLFEQIVMENPKDSITKVNLTDYWTGEATRYYEQQNYEEAKVRYQKALPYATKPALIQLQIQNSEAFIKLKADQNRKAEEPSKKAATGSQDTSSVARSKPNNLIDSPEKTKSANAATRNHRLGPKLLVGAVGLGAGAYAYSLNKQYQTKLDEVNRIGKMTDPDGDHIIMTAGEYDQWQTAYNEAKDSKRNRSKFVASLGVVGVAALTEVLLLAIPKSRKSTRISIESSTQSLGLGVRYTFK